MRWFYILAAGAVLGLGLLPFALLPSQGGYGDQVVVYDTYSAKIRSLDAATAGDTSSAAIQGYFYEGLYTYHWLNRPLEVIPQLAAEMPQISDDGLTYTIPLKTGVLFHRNEAFGLDENGSPETREMTAHDFVLAFKRVADYHLTTSLSLSLIQGKIQGLDRYRERTKAYNKGDFSRYEREEISGIRALDDHTLEIRLTTPFPQLIYVLAMNSYAPFPREVIDRWLMRNADGETIPVNERNVEVHEPYAVVGTGAFYLADRVRGGKIVLKRNEDYRPVFYPSEGEAIDRQEGRLDDAGKQVPFVDVVHLEYVAESHPAWMLFQTRQSDLSGIPADVYTQVITDNRELSAEMTDRGVRLIKYTTPAIYWYAFNMDDPVIGASRSLRQAMNLAYDVDKDIEILHNGRGIRALNTVPRDFLGHEEAGPSPYARFDLEAARAKLAQAKAELVEAGVLKPGQDIPKITVSLGGTSETHRRMAELIEQQYGNLGLNVEAELMDWPTLQEKVHNKRTQVYSMGWHADYPDPENFLQLYYSGNIDSGTNNTNYSNPEFDRLYARAAVMQDSPERTELYVRMIRMISEDCPVVLLSEPQTFVLVQPWVHNVKPHPIGYGYGKYRRIDVDARRKAGGRD